MFLLIAFAVLSITVSFLCSLLEAGLLSMTPSYVAQVRKTRPELHKQLARLKQNIDQSLTAILMGLAWSFPTSPVGNGVGPFPRQSRRPCCLRSA